MYYFVYTIPKPVFSIQFLYFQKEILNKITKKNKINQLPYLYNIY